MKGEDPEPEALKEHQRDQEQVERELIQEADSEPEAERHRRRADKAQYLRTKLEEQQRADREAADDADGEAADGADREAADGEAHQG